MPTRTGALKAPRVSLRAGRGWAGTAMGFISAPPAAPSCGLLSDRAEVRGAPGFMAFLPASRALGINDTSPFLIYPFAQLNRQL